MTMMLPSARRQRHAFAAKRLYPPALLSGDAMAAAATPASGKQDKQASFGAAKGVLRCCSQQRGNGRATILREASWRTATKLLAVYNTRVFRFFFRFFHRARKQGGGVSLPEARISRCRGHELTVAEEMQTANPNTVVWSSKLRFISF